MLEVKVKQSNYRLGQALRVPGGCGSQISRQSAHEGAKVVSPRHRSPLPPQEIFLVLICVLGSSVGIATDYGLDGPGSNPGGDEIFRLSRPALGPTQPNAKCALGLFQG